MKKKKKKKVVLKNKSKKRNSNERGASGLQMRYLVLLILLVLVVFAAIVILSRMGYTSMFNSLLPDFLIGNQTNYLGPRGCLSGNIEIGFIADDNYIVLNKKRTNLYIKNSVIMLYDPGMDWDSKVGKILGSNSGYEIIIDMAGYYPTSSGYYDANPDLPGPEDRVLLGRGTFLEGSSICSKKEIIDDIELQKSCEYSCLLLNGECKEKGKCLESEVFWGQIDCSNGNVCCLKESETILESEDESIKLGDDSMLRTLFSDNNLYDILRKTKFIITPGDRLGLVMYIKHEVPICYSFNSDIQNINTGFKSAELDSDSQDNNGEYRFIAGEFTFSAEKFINFAAWNKESGEKVLKRWKFEARDLPLRYEDGNVLEDSSFFKERMKSAPVLNENNGKRARFYLFLDTWNEWIIKGFGGGNTGFKRTYRYKVEKVDSESVMIYAWDEEEKEWHKMDSGTQYFSKKIALKELQDNLKQTLDDEESYSGGNEGGYW